MTNGDYNIRRKNGVSWRMITETSYGTTESSGFTVDNLDTKELDETNGTFEAFFVSLRRVLENNSSCCLDNEDERLKVCQEFAEFARYNSHYTFSASRKDQS